MNTRYFGAFLLAFAATGCATTEQYSTEPVSTSYEAFGGSWEQDGITVIAIRKFERDGLMAMCGAYASKGSELDLDAYNQQLLEQGYLTLDGVRVMTGMTWLADLGEDVAMKRGLANCVQTSIPWKASFAETPLEFASRTRFTGVR